MNKDKRNTLIEFTFNNIKHSIDVLNIILIGCTYESTTGHGVEPKFEFSVTLNALTHEENERTFRGSRDEIQELKNKLKSAKVYVDSGYHLRVEAEDKEPTDTEKGKYYLPEHRNDMVKKEKGSETVKSGRFLEVKAAQVSGVNTNSLTIIDLKHITGLQVAPCEVDSDDWSILVNTTGGELRLPNANQSSCYNSKRANQLYSKISDEWMFYKNKESKL